MEILILKDMDCDLTILKNTRKRRRESAVSAVSAQHLSASYDAQRVLTRSEGIKLAAQLEPTPELTTYGGIKLGWIQGVLIPCLLNIWGVIIFLRIAWIVGQAGMALSVLIILLSGAVCTLTTLSLSAICTNGELQGGGVYYLVSRSLGAELGASVGIIFAFANAVAASMNTIGFCDSLNELLRSHGVKIIDNAENDTRIIGSAALLLMCLICAVGMDWETKAQNFLIVTIVVAIFNFIIGAFIGPKSDVERAQGFVGINLETIKMNMGPDFRFSEGVHHDFFSIFAMYFPAVTGVQAGANICGDLKDPASAIPKGTLLALAISMSSYLALGLLSGAGALRDASGDTSNLTIAAITSCYPNCTYGLHNSYEIMQLMSGWGPLIYAGCWAATLSTALTNLLSVPRLIQALGIDRIYPGLIFFAKPYGKHGEPYRGYVLVFFVSLIFIQIADLNMIAPLISNFYLASYALINFCTFHASYIGHISWRPTFRYYNRWLSLFTTLACCGIMVVLSWTMALITVVLFIVLYLLVLYRSPEADWGSSREAQRYQGMVETLVRMTLHQHSVKAYNPQVLVLAGAPGVRPGLVQLAQRLTPGSYSLVAEICTEKMTRHQREKRCASGDEWLSRMDIKGFYAVLDGHDLESGTRALVQASGLGRLEPNILLVGYKYDWETAPARFLRQYVGVIRIGFEHQLGVAVMRLPPEQRRQHAAPRPAAASAESRSQAHLHVMHEDSDSGLADGTIITVPPAAPPARGAAPRRRQRGVAQPGDLHVMHEDSDSGLADDMPTTPQDTEPELAEPSASWLDSQSVATLTTSVMSMAPLPKKSDNRVQTLDAWWLYDDGGLNILLPYIVAYRGARPAMRMRVYALSRRWKDADSAKEEMEQLLAKFRIEYSSLTMLSDVDERAARASRELFDAILARFCRNSAVGNLPRDDSVVTETELRRQQHKTNRHLRLRELMLQHSSEADLVVMTLPIPRKRWVSPALYMAWLEVLSRDLPPTLFVRGSTCVLTMEA